MIFNIEDIIKDLEVLLEDSIYDLSQAEIWEWSEQKIIRARLELEEIRSALTSLTFLDLCSENDNIKRKS